MPIFFGCQPQAPLDDDELLKVSNDMFYQCMQHLDDIHGVGQHRAAVILFVASGAGHLVHATMPAELCSQALHDAAVGMLAEGAQVKVNMGASPLQ
jgi:hypothetical protein